MACRCQRLRAKTSAGALLRRGGGRLWASLKDAPGIPLETVSGIPRALPRASANSPRGAPASCEPGPGPAVTPRAVTAQYLGLSKAREDGKSKTTLLAKRVPLPLSLRPWQRISLQLKPQLRPGLKSVPE